MMAESDFDLVFQNQHLEGKIVASLERIAQAFRVLLWEESKQFSLSPIQVQILIFLLYHSEEKRKVSYLADEFNMTRATISDTIKSLEQKKLIRKARTTQDTRSFIITLTRKGKEIATQTTFFTQELRMPIDQLHPEDKENLLLSLMGIIRHLNKAGIISMQRMCTTCLHFKTNYKGHASYCQLLQQPLAQKDIRIDCPEHVAAFT